eukprot:scaffold217_cov377-Prasinococcus_capsulatus_cf.AAC.7
MAPMFSAFASRCKSAGETGQEPTISPGMSSKRAVYRRHVLVHPSSISCPRSLQSSRWSSKSRSVGPLTTLSSLARARLSSSSCSSGLHSSSSYSWHLGKVREGTGSLSSVNAGPSDSLPPASSPGSPLASLAGNSRSSISCSAASSPSGLTCRDAADLSGSRSALSGVGG